MRIYSVNPYIQFNGQNRESTNKIGWIPNSVFIDIKTKRRVPCAYCSEPMITRGKGSDIERLVKAKGVKITELLKPYLNNMSMQAREVVDEMNIYMIRHPHADIQTFFVKKASPEKNRVKKPKTAQDFIDKYHTYPPELIVRKLTEYSYMTVEHVRPWTKEKDNTKYNLLYVCSNCNGKRGCKDLDVFVAQNPQVPSNIKTYFLKLLKLFPSKRSEISFYINKINQRLKEESNGKIDVIL